MNETKEVHFLIKARYLPNGNAEVKIVDPYKNVHKVDAPFDFWMIACEFLMHKTAQKSNAGYEKAMELLMKGAMTYKEKHY